MKERKPKVNKIKTGSKVTVHSILFIILSLVLTFALFLGLIFAQNYLSEEITYQPVLVAKKDIPVGMIVTTENAAEYLDFKQVNVLDISSENLQSADALLGMKAKVRLVKGEPVMVKDFEDVVSYIEQFENPVEMSIAAPEASNADGGKLRAGDMINITLRYSNEQLGDNNYDTGLPANTNSTYSWFEPFELQGNDVANADENTDLIENADETSSDIDGTQTDEPATQETPVISPISAEPVLKSSSKDYNFENQYAYLLEGVYIHKVLDANGNEISPADTEATASILVLIVDRSDEIKLNERLENGASMRISKIVDKAKYLNTLKSEKEADQNDSANKNENTANKDGK